MEKMRERERGGGGERENDNKRERQRNKGEREREAHTQRGMKNLYLDAWSEFERVQMMKEGRLAAVEKHRCPEQPSSTSQPMVPLLDGNLDIGKHVRSYLFVLFKAFNRDHFFLLRFPQCVMHVLSYHLIQVPCPILTYE